MMQLCFCLGDMRAAAGQHSHHLGEDGGEQHEPHRQEQGQGAASADHNNYNNNNNHNNNYNIKVERQQIINPDWDFSKMGIGGLDTQFNAIFR